MILCIIYLWKNNIHDCTLQSLFGMLVLKHLSCKNKVSGLISCECIIWLSNLYNIIIFQHKYDCFT